MNEQSGVKQSRLHDLSGPRLVLILWCVAVAVWPWAAAVGLVPSRADWFENRTIEPWPDTPDSISTTQSFPSRFERAFTDRLGNRGYLIGLHSLLQAKVFGTSTTTSVLIGKEGWLFHNLSSNFNDHRGQLRLSDADKRKLRITFEERRDWLREIGSAYVVAVVPDKQTVYPEMVPSWIGPRQAPGAREQWLSYLDKVGSPLEVIDATPALIAGKPDGKLFYITDTHWVDRGALIAYQQILTKINGLVPVGQPMERDDFTATTTDLHTNLNKMLGLTDIERYERLNPTDGWRFSNQTIEDPALLKIGEQGVVSVREIDDPSLPTMFFLADSFAGWNSRFFANHFRRTVLTNTWGSGRTHRDHFPAYLIRRERPDVVLSQLVEGRIRVGSVPAWAASPSGGGNASIVRQARLRRLFAESGDAPRTRVEFDELTSTPDSDRYRLVLSGEFRSTPIVIIRFDLRSTGKVRLSLPADATRRVTGRFGEQTSVGISPGDQHAYLVAPTEDDELILTASPPGTLTVSSAVAIVHPEER